MATEADLYLRKAQESLESAEVDVDAGRYNSAANRAYYASFQAAVAALIHWGIRSPTTTWEHRFVPDEFATHLIRRRKVIPSELRGVLHDLFETRITADYESDAVSEKLARRGAGKARRFVLAVQESVAKRTTREPETAYNAGMTTKIGRPPEVFIEEFKARILEKYPDVEFKVIQRGERDFTLKVYGDYEDMGEVSDVLGESTMDVLEDHNIWIVVLGLDRHPLKD